MVEFKRQNMADGFRREWDAASFVKRWGGAVVAVFAVVSGLYGAATWVDARWAHAEEVQALEKRIEKRLDQTNVHVLDGQLRDVTGKTIQLEASLRSLTPSERQYLQQLRIDAETLRAEIKSLRERIK